jgi:riboflavin kinase/FMN adenylyltransferase
MRIVRDLNSYRKKLSKRLILAIGNFDGFHRGHRKLAAYVVAQARKYNAIPAVMTFPQHPQSVLHPGQKKLLLYSLEQKLFYLAQAGIELCFLPSFTPAFSRMTPEEFVEKVLVGKLHVLEVCMGYDAHFGRGREGTTDRMRALAGKNGFLFKKMGPVMIGRKPVSSSLIREYLAAGRIEEVKACLGRPFSLFGKVVGGKGHGTHLGFPTANLEVHSNMLIPLGVYSASARFLSLGPRDKGQGPRNSLERAGGAWRVVRGAREWLPGALNFGKRPTYPAAETPRPVLEMHLFHFHKNVRGREMEVAFHKFLRPEKRFKNEEALKAQILRDIKAAQRDHLGRPGGLD